MAIIISATARRADAAPIAQTPSSVSKAGKSTTSEALMIGTIVGHLPARVTNLRMTDPSHQGTVSAKLKS
jgi:hypothetical protein